MPRAYSGRLERYSAAMQRILVLAIVLAFALPGCATRTVQQKVVDEYGLTIKLRSQAKLFGETTPRGFEQPAVIDPSRIALILGGIEVDQRASDEAVVRERRPAVPAKILQQVSDGLAQAFSEASPDQEVIVLAIRKQLQRGIFHRKFLTSFSTYLKDGEMYVFLSRVDWPLDSKRSTDRLPEPQPGESPMPITTVGNAVYTKVGSQGVRTNWRRPEFGLLSETSAERSSESR